MDIAIVQEDFWEISASAKNVQLIALDMEAVHVMELALAMMDSQVQTALVKSEPHVVAELVTTHAMEEL